MAHWTRYQEVWNVHARVQMISDLSISPINVLLIGLMDKHYH